MFILNLSKEGENNLVNIHVLLLDGRGGLEDGIWKPKHMGISGEHPWFLWADSLNLLLFYTTCFLLIGQTLSGRCTIWDQIAHGGKAPPSENRVLYLFWKL